MDTNAQSAGIATLKPKRKYTKKPKLAVVKQVKPKVRQELPKTARAYLRTLGIAADKEGTAISELIKLHNEMAKKERKEYEVLAMMTAPAPAPVKEEEPKSLWLRFVRRFAS
jgi:hypothetical protein